MYLVHDFLFDKNLSDKPSGMKVLTMG